VPLSKDEVKDWFVKTSPLHRLDNIGILQRVSGFIELNPEPIKELRFDGKDPADDGRVEFANRPSKVVDVVLFNPKEFNKLYGLFVRFFMLSEENKPSKNGTFSLIISKLLLELAILRRESAKLSIVFILKESIILFAMGKEFCTSVVLTS
jgi:hypothetical protein